MRLLVLSGFYHPLTSGAEVFAQKYSAHRALLGDDVQILTGRWKKSLPKSEPFEGCKINRIAVLNAKNTRLVTFAASAALLGGKLASDSALMHAHLGFPAGFAGAVLKRRSRTPLITTVQGGDLGDYAENTGKVKALKRVIGWGLKHADAIHSVSKDCERKCRELGYENHIEVIPNGVDCSAFKPEARKEGIFRELHAVGKPIIFSASRLTPKNGLDHLIRAMPKVMREFPKAKLVLVGSGEQEQELKRLVASLRLNNDVVFAGMQPHSRLPEITASADVSIRPSLDEGFGISFIESMACGIPTIGTPVGGIKEIIQDGENGLMTKPADPEAIANSILAVLNDEKLAKKLGGNGIKTAKEKYDWQIVFNKMDALYEWVLDSKRS
ncbi:glycosyltransferase family 4 protein [archaeon]|nr:glycosyltransferase family 4 protein [archaeon]